MLTKSINVLKENPVLIVFYIVYIAIVMLITMLIIPKTPINQDPIAMLAMFGKMILGYLLLGILGLLFFSGYGHMLSQSVVENKTSAQNFFPGIKEYFVRVLLSTLLLLAIYIVFMIVMSIGMGVISMLLVMNSSSDPTGSIALMTILFMSVILLIVLFIFPFVLLWYPAIFIDDIGTIEGLKRGVRAGVKAYWKLVLAILAIYIPMLLYFVVENPFNMSGPPTYGDISYGPAYYLSIIVTSILSMILLPYIFVIYDRIRPQLTNSHDVS